MRFARISTEQSPLITPIPQSNMDQGTAIGKLSSYSTPSQDTRYSYDRKLQNELEGRD